MQKIILMVTLALAMLFITRGETVTIGGYTWTYRIVNGGAEICTGDGGLSCAVSPAPTGDLSIPSTLGEYALTSIGTYAFKDCTGLATVRIPSSVTNIGYYAFRGCSGLKSATIPTSVTSIGDGVFNGCTGLASMTIPSSVANIGNYAFSGCAGLASVTIPSSVASIGNYAFSGCSGLSMVEISDGVTRIGEQSFNNCIGLTSVTIPSSVTSVGAQAFQGCGGLTSVTIPEGVTSIGKMSFYKCSGLTSVTIPSSITNIGEYAFQGCKGLKSVKIQMGVSSISPKAFASCSGLMSVTIPSSVTNIGNSAFSSCSGLTSVTIPASVTSIGVGAFGDCCGLTSVTIPSSVTSIGASAFARCTQLVSLTFDGYLPNSADKIFGNSAEPSVVVHAKLGADAIRFWQGARILFDVPGCIEELGGTAGATETATVSLTVTNIVICYVMNSIQPERVMPASSDTGFVNIITEVKSGGAVSVPATWATNFPAFVTLFGDDFTKALTKPTGKVDGTGNAMLVWQDYVAGTDPTDPTSTFAASVTLVEGQPVVSWSPELNAEDAAKRTYTIWGKAKLTDAKWVEVAKGREGDYNFFKVSVEMR